jgi:putative Mg2+ transporter-C (MgtC) family protein
MDWTAMPLLLLAAALGAAIGLERELGAQPAGLRTHMLVSLGAALFTLAGTGIAHTDPTRVAAQVVTGVGFLGGGAIFKEGVNIRGLTTAASLWVTASVGLAIGLGEWLPALGATALALAVLWLVKVAESYWLPSRHRLRVTLTLQPGTAMDSVEGAVLAALPRARVARVDYADHEQRLIVTARGNVPISLPEIAERMRQLPGVQGVEILR